eukprot:CAMPEP_0198576710 /NCGR_PEP_ID=MMETSP1462-20131121/117975_1 /TAXON_ID=1333877 /ORGANISM="Brandtodinium nutriculum, Strain RCC3387" /LENGTH=199 /DNA_ID=CAMNT_0044307977 /DNA_START=315 /DNA_END=910 /DNA_ORIENTATION=-
MADVEVREALVKGHIHGEAAGALLARLLQRAGAREEAMIVPTVHAEEQHVGVVDENIARAIPMVHIPIDDGDALQAILSLCMTCSHCDIVEEAKPHGFVLRSVVARRAHDSHARADLGLGVQARIHEAQQGPCCQSRTPGRVLVDVRVRAEGEAVGLGLFPCGRFEVKDPVDEFDRVHALEFLLGSLPRRHGRAGLAEA